VAINKVGETLASVCERLQARAFRQSGDEFVILLKQKSVEEFLSVVSSFGHIPFSHKEEELETSMTLGYVRSDGKTGFNDLLERADVACKHAKASRAGACVEWTEKIELNPLVRRVGGCQKCGAVITANVPKQNAPTELSRCPCCGQAL
jgi:GGDEF domain-containing protein